MLEKPCCLLLYELGNHVAQDCAYSIEALISSAYVVQSMIIKKDLLDDENSNRFAKLRSCLHNAKAQWNDLCGQEKVNDIGRIVFD